MFWRFFVVLSTAIFLAAPAWADSDTGVSLDQAKQFSQDVLAVPLAAGGTWARTGKDVWRGTGENIMVEGAAVGDELHRFALNLTLGDSMSSRVVALQRAQAFAIWALPGDDDEAKATWLNQAVVNGGDLRVDNGNRLEVKVMPEFGKLFVIFEGP